MKSVHVAVPGGVLCGMKQRKSEGVAIALDPMSVTCKSCRSAIVREWGNRDYEAGTIDGARVGAREAKKEIMDRLAGEPTEEVNAKTKDIACEGQETLPGMAEPTTGPTTENYTEPVAGPGM